MEDEIVVIKVSDLKRLMQQCIREELKSLSLSVSQDEILNTDDVATLLKLSKGHIISLRRQNLPHYRVGTSIRYLRSEILEYLKKI